MLCCGLDTASASAQVVGSSAQVVSSSVKASAAVVSSSTVVGVSDPVANSRVVSPLLESVIKASCVSSIKLLLYMHALTVFWQQRTMIEY